MSIIHWNSKLCLNFQKKNCVLDIWFDPYKSFERNLIELWVGIIGTTELIDTAQKCSYQVEIEEFQFSTENKINFCFDHNYGTGDIIKVSIKCIQFQNN